MTASALLLVVEDEAPMRKLLAATLRGHGYRVAEAATAHEALTFAREHAPDVVLLDLGLPDADGLEVTRSLRAIAAMPILVISARGQERDKVAALDLGANDYVTKPFSVPELLARVRVALRATARGSTHGAESVVTFGDIRLDLAQRRITRAGAELRLTLLEFKLLAALAARAGGVVTPRELLREVWGPAHEDRGDYVRVYVHAIRHKLEVNPARPRFLLNETGIGYRLKVNDT